MPDLQPVLDGAVNSFPGSPPPDPPAPHTYAVHVKAECAAIIGWTMPPDWQRLLTAASDLRGFYQSVVKATDETRITTRLMGGRTGLENYRIALARGRELVDDLDCRVRGATGKDREVQALGTVQELARKVRVLAFELDLQQNHAGAQRQIERFAAASSAHAPGTRTHPLRLPPAPQRQLTSILSATHLPTRSTS
ncbi:hypothetical protein OG897_32030 [Streptomyces sp. NBC_00237]|uniref:hypothetical protein n=1 Tax=Streptomyces sp. NBC_00237 TaxID=2975687 RepID=UPI002255288A|nr:hypothetical protein [Streptomyces sp. NBC_00237]MCX5206032.1 hypothetical protein [Streptomyces sp. NBC_00237]